MKLTIERVANGFLIRNEEDLSGTVFEEKENVDFLDRESDYHMLCEIIEFFGLRAPKEFLPRRPAESRWPRPKN